MTRDADEVRRSDGATPNRCSWVGGDALYQAYHDQEWGVASRDDRYLFEMLCLEGAQAGLSWSTILNKREGYREAFHNFDREAVALMTDQQLVLLRENTAIVRNRLKIASVRSNALATIGIVREHGSLAGYLWSFVNDKPIINAYSSRDDVPVSTPQSDALSKDLKRRGFKFIGTTICYAFMQATGMVNDHTRDCFRFALLEADAGAPESAKKRGP
ncbi:MAG: DNA-3-methyladenine glycosylase I [Gammaproteobacteria bacterium]|jgi:DNA-3-methyladenine glycosylase I